MPFLDTDPIERENGVLAQDMTPKQLFDYFESWYTGLFGVALPQDRVREMSMFKRLKNVYGGEAGLIIKWCFYYHGGMRDRYGKPDKVKTFDWSSSMKWWHDILLEEMRERVNRELNANKLPETRAEEHKSRGFMTAGDLIGA